MSVRSRAPRSPSNTILALAAPLSSPSIKRAEPNMSTNGKSDFAVRTISDDGTFRVLIARTTETARGVLNAQNPDPDKSGLLADLVSAAVLLRLTMSPDYRLQAIIQRRGVRSEEHTSELQSRGHLVCRLLLEKKKTT